MRARCETTRAAAKELHPPMRVSSDGPRLGEPPSCPGDGVPVAFRLAV